MREVDSSIKLNKNSCPFRADVGSSQNQNESRLSDEENDIESLAMQRKAKILNTFSHIYAELTTRTFALWFYLTVCRESAKQNKGEID